LRIARPAPTRSSCAGSASRHDPATIVAGNTQYYVQDSFCALNVATPRLILSKNRADLTLRNRACTGVNVARP
jgi:hypothetical protein